VVVLGGVRNGVGAVGRGRLAVVWRRSGSSEITELLQLKVVDGHHEARLIALQGLLITLNAGEGSSQFFNLGGHVGDGLLNRQRLLGARACHGEQLGWEWGEAAAVMGGSGYQMMRLYRSD
jgi:hypothetical protein